MPGGQKLYLSPLHIEYVKAVTGSHTPGSPATTILMDNGKDHQVAEPTADVVRLINDALGGGG